MIAAVHSIEALAHELRIDNLIVLALLVLNDVSIILLAMAIRRDR